MLGVDVLSYGETAKHWLFYVIKLLADSYVAPCWTRNFRRWYNLATYAVLLILRIEFGMVWDC